MTENEIGRVVELHCRHVPDALAPRLGEGFMTALYSTMLESRDCRVLVWEEEGRVEGFIAACLNTGGLAGRVVLSRFFACLAAAISFILRNPADTGLLLDTVLYPGMTQKPGVRRGELLFIALEPSARGGDASDHLVSHCLQWLKENGMDEAAVTTSARNRGANELLERAGFCLERAFDFRGVKTRLYVKSLAGQESSAPGGQAGG
jgi:GNAT superfamily N-acetyltransferase